MNFQTLKNPFLNIPNPEILHENLKKMQEDQRLSTYLKFSQRFEPSEFENLALDLLLKMENQRMEATVMEV